MTKHMTLKPGLLVSLKTTIKGGIEYRREDLGSRNDGVTDTAQWRTTRVIHDVEKTEAAKVARSAAAARIRGACIPSLFGLLCPLADEPALDEAIAYAAAVAAEHNSQPGMPQVGVYVLRGRIATQDEEAVKAIVGEVRDLLDAMQLGIQEFNVDAVRDAAAKAKKIGGMLDASVSDRVGEAVKAARSAARKIVKAVEVNATSIDTEVVAMANRSIESARIAFLDLDETPAAVTGDAMPAITARDLDLGDQWTAPVVAAVTAKMTEVADAL